MSSRSVVFLIVSPGLVLMLPSLVMAAGPAPEGDAPATVESQPAQPVERNPSLEAIYGVPAPEAEFTPDTTADPGFVERAEPGVSDQTYGPAGQSIGPDGQPIEGLTIYGQEDLLPPEDITAETPEYHVVQPGDTLWDISGYYMNDPYGWPKLWSWNEHVTNAHWIFPGDRIRLHDPLRRRRERAEDEPSLRFSKTRLPEKAERESYMLNQFAFVEAQELEGAMEIIGGGDANVMMATLDTAYMSYDSGNPPIPGERLVVYAPQEEVRDVESRKVLGHVVQIMGEVEIESIAREAAEGTIMNALNPIERGYRVGPLRRVFRRIETVEAETSATGQVIATISSTGPIPIKSRRPRRSRDPELLAGEEQFVVLNLGAGQGLRPGHVLEVVRKGDAYTKKRVFKIPYEDGWPRRVIGAVLIVEAQENSSLAAIVYSRQEIERGDHVELRGPGLDGEKAEVGPAPATLDAEAEGEVQTGGGEVKAKGSFEIGN